MKFLTDEIDTEYKPGLYRKKTMKPAELAGQFIRKWDEKRLDEIKRSAPMELPPCVCFSRKIGGGALEIADILAGMVGFPVINNEIIEYSKWIKNRFPDAFIIAVKDGEIISMEQALKESVLQTN